MALGHPLGATGICYIYAPPSSISLLRKSRHEFLKCIKICIIRNILFGNLINCSGSWLCTVVPCLIILLIGSCTFCVFDICLCTLVWHKLLMNSLSLYGTSTRLWLVQLGYGSKCYLDLTFGGIVYVRLDYIAFIPKWSVWVSIFMSKYEMPETRDGYSRTRWHISTISIVVQ